MQKLAAILLSFLSAVTVMAQNDALESINTEVEETISNPQYDFAPDAGSPDVEVAPLAVNNEDKDVPLQPVVDENATVEIDASDENH